MRGCSLSLCVQIQSAPAVDLKSHPRDASEGDGITIQPPDSTADKEEDRGSGEEDMDTDSPRPGVKMSFGVRSKTGSGATGGGGGGGGGGSNGGGTPLMKRTMDTNVLGPVDESELDAPKKKLASIQQIEKEQRDEKALEREVSRMAARYSVEERKRIPAEEKKRMIQTLVKEIPTTKEELFEYELKWEAIDQVKREREGVCQ